MAEVSIVFTDNSTITGDGSEEHPLAASGGGVVPGGANTDVQFNDAGSFGGDSRFTFNKATGKLTFNNPNPSDITILSGSASGNGLNVINSGNTVELSALETGWTLDLESSGQMLFSSGSGSGIFFASGGVFSVTAPSGINMGVTTGPINLKVANANILSIGVGPTLGMFGSVGTGQPTITGSKGGNTALASLITALAAFGLVIDATT